MYTQNHHRGLYNCTVLYVVLLKSPTTSCPTTEYIYLSTAGSVVNTLFHLMAWLLFGASTCRQDSLKETAAMERSVPPCDIEIRQHTVYDASAMTGWGQTLSETRSPIEEALGYRSLDWFIRSLLVGNDRMLTMGRHVAWSTFASTHPATLGSVPVNYSGTLSVPRLVTRHSFCITCHFPSSVPLYSLV
jgi:hypothetical protein